MNLHDIVKRGDRMLVVDRGSVQPAHRAGADGFLGARLEPQTQFRLVDVQRCSSLRHDAPLGWDVLEGDAEIEMDSREIRVKSASGALIRSSKWWSSREHLLPFASGEGLEVGPGQNPHIQPSATTHIRYLEDVGKDEWMARYHIEPSPESEAMWRHYIVGDAQTLDGIADALLDFIYSSHVFEHLMNPLGVLARWSARLKPGGSALAVIPDCRYCFDLQQEPSTLQEFLREFSEERWTPGRDKYEKWSSGTAAGSNPDKLMDRRYPIHSLLHARRVQPACREGRGARSVPPFFGLGFAEQQGLRGSAAKVVRAGPLQSPLGPR